MQEKEVEQYLNKRVKNDLRGLSLKFVSPGFNGVPDRIILIPEAECILWKQRPPVKQCVNCRNGYADRLRV